MGRVRTQVLLQYDDFLLNVMQHICRHTISTSVIPASIRVPMTFPIACSFPDGLLVRFVELAR